MTEIDNIVTLSNVRLAFPQLFAAKAFEDGQTPRFTATFIIDPKEHTKVIAKVEKLAEALVFDKFNGKPPKKLTRPIIQDGNDKDYVGFEDKVFINAASKRRPVVIDRSKQPITEDDGIIYGGCYVNASVGLWVQNNQWGKAVNAELRGVQFVKDGEAFGAGAPVNVDSEFEELEPEEDYLG